MFNVNNLGAEKYTSFGMVLVLTEPTSGQIPVKVLWVPLIFFTENDEFS